MAVDQETANSHTNGTSEIPSAWSAPGSAAFDFRSDVTTRPTPSMLAAIERATLGDDVFLDDKDTTDLEAFIAELTGFPAALLVVSGTMGNQLSMRTHLGGPPHSIVADARSHIIGWWVLSSSLSPENESSSQPSCPFPHSPPTLPFKLTSPPGHREAGFLASLSGALAIPITPSNVHHLTLSDIKSHTITSTDIHACPTTLISLENTLNGSILPLSSCRAIAAWAHSQSPPIAMHLDGARLWEAVSAGAGSLMEYCACFDSVSLCFSKGLGAPIGSMIVGSQAFIGRARHIRKGLGGGMRQAGVVSAPARVAVEETFLGGKLDGARVRAREIARRWEERGGRLQHPVETNMVWLDLEAAGVDVGMFVERGVEKGLKVIGGRLVVHYQISSEAIDRLTALFDTILPRSEPTKQHQKPPPEPSRHVKQEAEAITASAVE